MSRRILLTLQFFEHYNTNSIRPNIKQQNPQPHQILLKSSAMMANKITALVSIPLAAATIFGGNWGPSHVHSTPPDEVVPGRNGEATVKASLLTGCLPRRSRCLFGLHVPARELQHKLRPARNRTSNHGGQPVNTKKRQGAFHCFAFRTLV